MDNPRITINNNTKETLTEIEFGIESAFIADVDSLAARESYASKIIFDERVKGDGAYILKYNVSGVQHTHSFGYFTNGKSMNRLINVDIETDTIYYSYN
jgi:hypothetical protein